MAARIAASADTGRYGQQLMQIARPAAMDQPHTGEILVLGVGGRRLPVIKLVEELAGIDLPQAVALIEQAPFVVPAPSEHIEALADRFVTHDCRVVYRILEPAHDELDRIEHLAELHQQGVLSDDEFAHAKRVLLSRI
jgi:ribosomal protein L7/L12